MSLKESVRQREIRNHGHKSAEIICNLQEQAKRKEERIKRNNSPEFVQNSIRRSALQQLDRADMSTTKSRIVNTIKFAHTTLEMFTNEYNSLPVKDEKALTKLIFNYRTHISKLNTFDNEVEFNNSTYTQNLTELFAKQICKLNPLFVDIITPKTHSI